MTLVTTCVGVAPIPIAASRILDGTRLIASSAVSRTVGSISSASATPPAGAENSPVTTTTVAKANTPARIDGSPVSTLAAKRTAEAVASIGTELGDVDRRQDSERHADQGRDGNDHTGADDRVAEAAAGAPSRRAEARAMRSGSAPPIHAYHQQIEHREQAATAPRWSPLRSACSSDS